MRSGCDRRKRCGWIALAAVAGLCLSPVVSARAADLPAPTAPDASRVSSAVREAIARDGRARVLVELALPFTPEGRLSPTDRGFQRLRILDERRRLLDGLAGPGLQVGRTYETLPFASLEVDAATLARLERSPRVRSVRPNRWLRPNLDITVPVVQGDIMRQIGMDGAGQVVVVADTGVFAEHSNLQGKLVGEACFAEGPPSPFFGHCPNNQDSMIGDMAGRHCTYSDECFHGTLVSGIAIGEGHALDGVATGADLISIFIASRVDDAGFCAPDPAPCPRIAESDITAALEEVYTNFRFSHTIAAVNLSVGGLAYTTEAACDAASPALKAAVDNLRSVDIATVSSSGNAGLDDAIGSPACISSVVSVSATREDDTVPGYPNVASFLDLFAPGDLISGPRYTGEFNYITASGTSFAAPHVAGGWATLRQAAPTASVDEILAALQATGVPITEAGITKSRIALFEAFVALTAACNNGVDDDGDGFIDYPADVGCVDALGITENPVCQDGLDNDNDGGWDFDGGAAANGGVPLGPADADCVAPNAGEAQGCGLGAELGLLALVLLGRPRRVRRPASRRA